MFCNGKMPRYYLGDFFHDLLKPCSIPCKVLQEDEICVVCAIKAIMKTKKSLEKMKSTEITSVKKVIGQIKKDSDDSSVTYQGIELKSYDTAIFTCSHTKVSTLKGN